LNEAENDCRRTQKLNHVPLGNTFGAICLHCGSYGNSIVEQFVDALETSIMNGLAFRGLCDTNCKEDTTGLQGNLTFLTEGT
jgi:hypothetical protein